MRLAQATTKTLVLLLVAGLMASAVLGGTAMAAYPERPIEVMVPWPAGGGTDLAARQLVEIINQEGWLPQPLRVVNKPGASGIVGTDELLRVSPDGYYIGYQTSGTLMIQPLLNDLSFTSTTFPTVLRTFQLPTVLVVRSDAQWQTAEEFIQYAAKNPGRVRVGHPGNYTVGHLVILGLAQASNTQLVAIPFQGSAPAVTALLGGHIEAAMVQIVDVVSFLREGRLRVLLTTETERLRNYPDVPTVYDLGYNPPAISLFHLLIVPPGTPQDVIDTLEEAFRKAVESERFAAFAEQQGGQPAYLDGASLAQQMAEAEQGLNNLLTVLGLK